MYPLWRYGISVPICLQPGSRFPAWNAARGGICLLTCPAPKATPGQPDKTGVMSHGAASPRPKREIVAKRVAARDRGTLSCARVPLSLSVLAAPRVPLPSAPRRPGAGSVRCWTRARGSRRPGQHQLQAVGAVGRGVREALFERLHQRAQAGRARRPPCRACGSSAAGRAASCRDGQAGLGHAVEQERHAGVAVAAEVHGGEDDAAVGAFAADHRVHRLHRLDHVGLAHRRAVHAAAVRARDRRRSRTRWSGSPPRRPAGARSAASTASASTSSLSSTRPVSSHDGQAVAVGILREADLAAACAAPVPPGRPACPGAARPRAGTAWWDRTEMACSSQPSVVAQEAGGSSPSRRRSPRPAPRGSAARGCAPTSTCCSTRSMCSRGARVGSPRATRRISSLDACRNSLWWYRSSSSLRS